MTDTYTDLVNKIYSDCLTNLTFVESRLRFMKSMKREHSKLLMVNGLTYDEIVRAWEEGVDKYKKR